MADPHGIKAALLGRGCAYVMTERGDIWRFSTGWDGLPIVEAYLLGVPGWPSEIIDECETVAAKSGSPPLCVPNPNAVPR